MKRNFGSSGEKGNPSVTKQPNFPTHSLSQNVKITSVSIDIHGFTVFFEDWIF